MAKEFLYYIYLKKQVKVMTKILVTENQLVKIKNFIIENENDKSYHREVNVKVWGNRSKFNGMDIEDISDIKMTVLFDIEEEHRSWGIKDVLISNIRGDKQIEVEVGYYSDDLDDVKYENVILSLDWGLLNTEPINGKGIVTVDDVLEIELTNDEEGNLKVDSMNMNIYTL